MRRYLIPVIFILLSAFGAAPVLSQSSVNVGKILSEIKDKKLSRGDRASIAASSLIGADARSLAESYLDSANNESNLLPFNSKQFVETAIALAFASEKLNPDSALFLSELDAVRYRKGENSGYASNMIYASDWIADNNYRGKLKEKTYDLPDNTFMIKTLDYVSSHRNQFAGLRDSIQFERQKSIEMGLRAHKIPYMKLHTIGKKNIIEMLRSGDIIVIIGKEEGMDLYDMGIILIENSLPYLIHADAKERKIVKEKSPVYEYLKPLTKEIRGYRLLRLPE